MERENGEIPVQQDLAQETAIEVPEDGTTVEGQTQQTVVVDAATAQGPQKEQPQTNAVLDLLMSDPRRVFSVAGAFILFVGSYCNFWGIYSEELGHSSQGNLFTGYLLGGLFGKLCVAGAFAVVILICLGLVHFAWYGALASLAAFAVQTVLVAVFGWNVFGDAARGSLYPGLGSFISLAGLAVMLYFSWKLHGERTARG